ncbi:MAG: hypothetical protein CMA05_04660 [Euryarchaeota archaeon]|nr:hypothetical protein [Euryarchaeota archaeon]
MYGAVLRPTVPVKLFGVSWMRQTRSVQTMLSDADIPFTYVDIGDLPHMASALETIVGKHVLPVLLVDGKPYKGVERVRKYIKSQ